MNRREALKLLGLNSDYSADDLKKAYRKVCKVAHPDVGGNADYFKSIVTAYELLKTKTKTRGMQITYENLFKIKRRG